MSTPVSPLGPRLPKQMFEPMYKNIFLVYLNLYRYFNDVVLLLMTVLKESRQLRASASLLIIIPLQTQLVSSTLFLHGISLYSCA